VDAARFGRRHGTVTASLENGSAAAGLGRVLGRPDRHCGRPPAIRATWHATHLPDGHGSINAGFKDGLLNYEVMADGVKTWVGAVPLSTAFLWLIGPPLLLWLLWLMVRERPAVRQAALGNADGGTLPAGTGPAPEWRVDQDERVGADRGRVRTPNP